MPVNIKKLTNSFISLFFPCLCPVCKEPLTGQENSICWDCSLSLPKTNSYSHEENRAAKRFYGKIQLERAASYLYYNKRGAAQKIVYEIKYKRNLSLGRSMGEAMAKDILASGFFEGIDCIMPVPLHKKKLKYRGFNQSLALAEGISEVSRIPIENKSLVRKKFSATQTKKGLYARWLNTKNRFTLYNKESFQNKHILLVDDVLTTGSTLEACAQCFRDIEGIKISVLTLAVT